MIELKYVVNCGMGLIGSAFISMLEMKRNLGGPWYISKIDVL